MKKKYIKPMVLFEDFSLSQSVALGCDLKSNHARYECAYCEDEHEHSDDCWTVFTSSVSNGCSIDVTDDPSNGFCYDIPTGALQIFTS